MKHTYTQKTNCRTASPPPPPPTLVQVFFWKGVFRSHLKRTVRLGNVVKLKSSREPSSALTRCKRHVGGILSPLQLEKTYHKKQICLLHRGKTHVRRRSGGLKLNKSFAQATSFRRGFSLVGMLVATGLLGGLAIGFAELMRTTFISQQRVLHFREFNSLTNEIELLLENEKHCRVSIAGPGQYGTPCRYKVADETVNIENCSALTFQKSAIDGDGDEGKEVKLYASTQDGQKRGPLMFSSATTDAPKNRYNSLTIKSIKLLMNKGSENTDYAEMLSHEDIGTLRVTVQGDQETEEESFDLSLSVWMKTVGDGTTTLLSCARSGSSSPRCGTGQTWHPKCGCILKDRYNPDLDLNCESPIAQIIQQTITENPPLPKCANGYSANCGVCMPKCYRAYSCSGGRAFYDERMCRCVDTSYDCTP